MHLSISIDIIKKVFIIGNEISHPAGVIELLIERRNAIVVCLIVLFWSDTASAHSLMQAVVPINHRSQVALKSAFSRALVNVLVKVSGNFAVMTLPTIQNQLQHVEDVVKAYTYVIPAPGKPSLLMLKVLFDSQAIEQLLKTAGQPVWNRNRPSTLIWLDIEQPNQSIWVGSDDVSNIPLASMLAQYAKNRGLKVFFPSMDLEDQRHLSSSFSLKQIQMASQRYQVSSILWAQAQKIDGLWHIQWRYVLDGNTLEWHSQSSSLNSQAFSAINTLINTIMSQLITSDTAEPKHDVWLKVDGITNLYAYAKVQALLNKMSSVQQWVLKAATLNSLILRIRYYGTLNAFQKALSRNSHWQKEMTTLSAQALTQPLIAYYWLGKQ